MDRFALIDHPLLLVLQLVCLVHLKRVLLPAALGLLLLCVIPLCYFMPLDGCRHCGGSCSSSSSVFFFFLWQQAFLRHESRRMESQKQAGPAVGNNMKVVPLHAKEESEMRMEAHNKADDSNNKLNIP